MMITKVAKAGTLESNDILIMVMPNDKEGISLEIESIVLEQFGNQIRKTILSVLENLEIKNIKIIAQDKGALDFTIEARLETAIRRGSEIEVKK